jgi:KDO2-lipid IV(A) lauroyltransferase
MLALLGFRTADQLVRRLPLPASQGLARGLARLAFACRVPARRRLEDNLLRLLGPGHEARIPGYSRDAFDYFARTMVDFLRLRRMAPAGVAGEIEVRGGAHLETARHSGRGVILLSAHVGNWEWGAAYVSSLGPRLHVAAREHAARGLEAWFARLRAQHGVARLAGRPLWPAAARALRRHEWVAVMGDRVPAGGSGSACAWVALLARRTGALILPTIVLHRPGGGYALCFEPPLTPRECLGGGYARVVRGTLERHPGQWLGFEALPEGLA